MMQLRYYQNEAIASIYDYFSKHGGNPVLAMPTGTGKSVVIAAFIKGLYERWPAQRVLMLTHVKELIEQNYEKLLAVWPTAPIGIYSASVGRKEIHAKITFAGIDSIVNRASAFRGTNLVIIDECHLVNAKTGTRYEKFLAALKEFNPNLKVIGLSATPYRLGLGSILDGGIFTDTCYDITSMSAFNKLITDGYLAPLIPKRTTNEMDTSQVKTSGGEYVLADLQEAVDHYDLNVSILSESATLAAARKHWLIFATGIKHAANVCDLLNNMGIPTAVVHSKLTKHERESIIARYKAGEYRALVNNNILTTGFDFPQIDCILVLRPTQSAVLWVQMLGRGTRPYPEKQNCLVLDFAGNTKRLGPINDPVLPRKKKKGLGGVSSAPVKVCPACNTYAHASVRECPECHYIFPKILDLDAHAGIGELIADGVPVTEDYIVSQVVYSTHRRNASSPVIKVDYYCGIRKFTEYVCLEHFGYAAKKARTWWRQRCVEEGLPETTEQALLLTQTLKTPYSIRVWLNKRYPEIINYIFS